MDRRIVIDGLMAEGGFFGGIRRTSLEIACKRTHTSRNFVNAVNHSQTTFSDSTPAICKNFYKIQSLQQLGEANKQVLVPIWIARNRYRQYPKQGDLQFKEVHVDWIDYLMSAMDKINRAAPGLHLYRVMNEGDAKIKVYGTRTEEIAATCGNILQSEETIIFLYDEWKEKKGTSVHELFHALGVQHEHQRRDADTYYAVKSNDSRYETLQEVFGITRFDPFSIMAYPETDGVMVREADFDTVWRLKPQKYNTCMSELDKVTLNNLYRPCKGSDYSPKLTLTTGIWYCGRPGSTSNHNQPASSMTDGRCGPTNGPNCPPAEC